MKRFSFRHAFALALILLAAPVAVSAQDGAQKNNSKTPTAQTSPTTEKSARNAEGGQKGQTEEALEIADKVQATYDKVQDFTARFTQEYTSVSMGSTRASEGRVFFKKPGKMRWDYAKPDERYMISDGKSLWVYEPEFAQYYSESLQESQLPSALRFLMGKGQLRDEFAIRIRTQDADKITLELVPKERSSQFSRLHFVVDDKTSTVLEITVFDALGNANRLRFHDVKQNSGLPDKGFDFEAPKGTTRVKAPSN